MDFTAVMQNLADGIVGGIFYIFHFEKIDIGITKGYNKRIIYNRATEPNM